METRYSLSGTLSHVGTVRAFVVLAMALLFGAVALAAVPSAYAYDPSNPLTPCANCHGREADEASGTVGTSRKGPHGGYGATTRKCAACHSVHAAAADGYALLPGATVEAVCESCHDGTGGRGVYGAIEARGGTVRSAHRVEVTSEIPGGDPAGGGREGSFSGFGGTLSCVDCHSPHDSDTVEAFLGDRLRSADDTGTTTRTNRLLKALPGPDGTRIERYGSEWCASCHQGYHLVENGIDPVTGTANRHPVGFSTQIEGELRFYYDSVRVATGAESTETAWGPLGGSNRGYVMPHVPGDMLGFYGPQQGNGPLCQQCHEDARDVGGVLEGSPVLLSDQEFAVSAYGPEADASSSDNPYFQVFPHESDQPGFSVTPSDPDEPPVDGLCLRCHVPGS